MSIRYRCDACGDTFGSFGGDVCADFNHPGLTGPRWDVCNACLKLCAAKAADEVRRIQAERGMPKPWWKRLLGISR